MIDIIYSRNLCLRDTQMMLVEKKERGTIAAKRTQACSNSEGRNKKIGQVLVSINPIHCLWWEVIGTQVLKNNNKHRG